jgi:hypothetical protein
VLNLVQRAPRALSSLALPSLFQGGLPPLIIFIIARILIFLTREVLLITSLVS